LTGGLSKLKEIWNEEIKENKSLAEEIKEIKEEEAQAKLQIEADYLAALEEMNVEFSKKIQDPIKEIPKEIKKTSRDYFKYIKLGYEETANIFETIGDRIVNTQKATSSDVLDIIKDELKARIDAYAAGEAGKLAMAAFGTFGLSLLGLVVVQAARIAANSAIDSIQLANGGSFVVDKKTNLGGGVVAGERGQAERVTVEPLDMASNRGGDMTINLMVDGTKLADTVIKNYNKARTINTVTKIKEA
jgi:hypothetical protein